MFFLLNWLVYGLFVGFLAKIIYKGQEPTGWISTMLVGIAGSYVGGFIYYLLSSNLDAFRPAGLLLSVLGGVTFLFLWQKYLNVK